MLEKRTAASRWVADDDMAEAQLESRYQELEGLVREYHPEPNLELLRRCFEFAVEYHDGQTRRSGESYVTHLLGVAEIIAQLHLDIDSLCAALLHDVVEDTPATAEQVSQTFNDEIAFLVDGVTKLSKMRFNTSEERQAETIRKMIVAMSRDLRVVLVKLADRVHNMRTLDHMPEDKQRRIAQETMDIYAPLANRFGINWIKQELEDTSFRYLHGDAYYDLAQRVAKKRRERERYITEVIGLLDEVLIENHVRADLQGRPKHFYSIYKKMKRQNIDFEQVYDILAFRIVVEEKFQCYEALGIVHNLWKPIPARFKDYIAMPKPNGYQSLHTSVIGPYREPIEIQIRTHSMHKVAEEGVAAHWLYKEGGYGRGIQEASEFTWVRHLIEDFKEVADPRDFMERLKLDLFSQEVFAFTPKGDIRAFPVGATVVDFAYAIHTEVGDHCSGAKVNGSIVPFSYALQNGDVVEIITRKNQRPNKDWLEHVRTGRARSKITHFLRTESRQQAEKIGREMLDSELRKHGLQLKALAKKGKLKDAADALRLQTDDEMLVKLGYGTLSVKHIIKELVPEVEKTRPVTAAQTAVGNITRKVSKLLGRKTGVRIDGIDDDLMVRYARCCNPVPGEDIIGFVTRGRGLTVHTSNCDRVDHLEPERRIEVFWDQQAIRDKEVVRTIRVEVITQDSRGILAAMSQAFSVTGINIREAHCQTKGGRAINVFDLVVTDFKQLERAIASVRKVQGVMSVTRKRA